MTRFPAAVSVLALAALATSCHSTKAPAVLDSALASYIPSGTVVIAGINLQQLRATPLYRSIPSRALPVNQALDDASYVVFAYNSRDLIVLWRGKFREAPPATTLASSELAIAGSAESIRAAVAQHQTGVTGSPRLLELAAGVAEGRQIWMAAQGGVTLPLTGNLANLNRILHFTDSATMSARIDSGAQVDATGVGRSPDASRQLEESLRAILTLAGAASGRNSSIGTMLKSIEIRRDGLTVHASLAATSETLQKVVPELMR